MPEVAERIRGTMDEVMRTNPLLHLATVSVEGRPHSSSVWFAPSKDLECMYWLSSPTRQHSHDIFMHQSSGKRGGAPVSGSMAVLQRPSMPVVGLSFEGHALEVLAESHIKEALGAFTTHRVFLAEEIEKYLHPPVESGTLPHSVYGAHIASWTLFDGRLPNIDDRKQVVDWPLTEN